MLLVPDGTHQAYKTSRLVSCNSFCQGDACDGAVCSRGQLFYGRSLYKGATVKSAAHPINAEPCELETRGQTVHPSRLANKYSEVL